MIDFIAVVVMLAGVVFLFAAMLGLLRFADPLQRIHATTKSGTVGAGLILLGVMITWATHRPCSLARPH